MNGLALACGVGVVWLGIATVTAVALGRYLARREAGPPEGEA